MNRKNSLKLNYIYNVAYSLLSMIMPLITAPYISRVIGSKGIGIFSYDYTVASYFMQFALLGIGFYGNRSIAKVKDDGHEAEVVFSEIYTMQLFCSFLMIVLYILYVFIFVHDNITIALIMLFYVAAPAINVSWFFQGLENFKVTVTRNVVIKILTVILIFAFVKTKSDLWVYSLIMSAGTFFSEGYLIFLAKKYVHYHVPKIKEVIKHLKPNIVLFIPVLAVSIYRSMDKLMLKWLVGYDEVGYYSNSEKVINALLSAITALGQVMMPRMTYLLSNRNHESFLNLAKKSLKFISIVSSAMAFGIAGIADNFIPIFFGPGYEKCVVLTELLSVNLILLALGHTIKAELLIPMEKDSLYIKSVALGAVVNVIVNMILIPQLHAVGAIIGTISAELISLAIIMRGIKNEYPVKETITAAVPYLVIGAIMFLSVQTVNLLLVSNVIKTVIQIITGGIVYVFFAVVYWKYTKDEMGQQILNAIRKVRRK